MRLITKPVAIALLSPAQIEMDVEPAHTVRPGLTAPLLLPVAPTASCCSLLGVA